jgi:hypothetical protein
MCITGTRGEGLITKEGEGLTKEGEGLTKEDLAAEELALGGGTCNNNNNKSKNMHVWLIIAKICVFG